MPQLPLFESNSEAKRVVELDTTRESLDWLCSQYNNLSGLVNLYIDRGVYNDSVEQLIMLLQDCRLEIIAQMMRIEDNLNTGLKDSRNGK